MILGIGSDIIEIGRIQRGIDRYGEKFLHKILTQKEIDYCLLYKKDPATHVAGRFAGKEAIVKSLGIGFGDLEFHDIEILNDLAGKPQVFLSDKANQLFNHPEILVTISHCKSYAVGFALWNGTLQ